MTDYSVPASFTSALDYNVVLDGNPYQLTVYMQAFSGRLYFSISDQSGNVVVNMALISSIAYPNLLVNYFTKSTMSYIPEQQLMVVLP